MRNSWRNSSTTCSATSFKTLTSKKYNAQPKRSKLFLKFTTNSLLKITCPSIRPSPPTPPVQMKRTLPILPIKCPSKSCSSQSPELADLDSQPSWPRKWTWNTSTCSRECRECLIKSRISKRIPRWTRKATPRSISTPLRRRW